MTVYYHSASELEFCLRIYYCDEKKTGFFGLILLQYRVDCVIVPDTTESIAVRIVIMKCMLHCVLLNNCRAGSEANDRAVWSRNLGKCMYVCMYVYMFVKNLVIGPHA